ncbi:MAG: GxxExxY protein [Verrucomicrobiales bacterium]|nr:GxxExxY protein [Verrucomicrobiales bacterium]
MNRFLFEKETYQIRGACFEVYREKGCGFLESVYQACLEIELADSNVPFQSQPEIRISYKERNIEPTFKPDLICFGSIIVELKSVTALGDVHRAQVHNYLKSTDHRLGLLVNFGHYPKLEIERIIQ